jgi:enoyl-CoA hydratase/carnithine racemase
MTSSLVLRDDRDGVATLTLNRPDKLNALTPAVFAALRAHLEAVAADEAVRCVVLAGAGRSFCAGHDLGSIASEEEEADPRFAPETIDRLEALAQPTIARIQGHCFTGGLELALGCDLLVAAAGAQLGDTHGQWGLMPVWGMSVRLPERVGVSRAKELMFTSRRIDGAEAARIGLVDRSVPDGELDAEVGALAAEVAANSSGTNRIDKALLRARGGMSREAALLFERTEPFGRPSDMAERLTAAPGRG